jgi:hypothetical protein
VGSLLLSRRAVPELGHCLRGVHPDLTHAAVRRHYNAVQRYAQTLLGISSGELDEHIVSRLHFPTRAEELGFQGATEMRKIAYTACWLHCGASVARRRPTDAIAVVRTHHNAPALRAWQRVTDVIQPTYDDLNAQGESQHLSPSEVGTSTHAY